MFVLSSFGYSPLIPWGCWRYKLIDQTHLSAVQSLETHFPNIFPRFCCVLGSPNGHKDNTLPPFSPANTLPMAAPNSSLYQSKRFEFPFLLVYHSAKKLSSAQPFGFVPSPPPLRPSLLRLISSSSFSVPTGLSAANTAAECLPPPADVDVWALMPPAQDHRIST